MDTEVMDTEHSGNTKNLRARAFQFTLNEVEKWDILKSYLESLKSCDYFIACLEKAPTTGHEHIHCYAHFKQARNISIKKCAGAHIEICRGSPKDNIAYIEKDGNIIAEYGNKPHQGSRHTVAELREIDNPDELMSYEYNTWLKIKKEPKKIRVTDVHKADLIVYYITGSSGSGKSKKAYELLTENGYEEFDNISYENGFYNGISDGTGAAIYDDFRPSDMKANEFIKLIDYNIHTMNIKGGYVDNRYKLIIITSIISPYFIYGNLPEESKQQWLRRIKIINMDSLERSFLDI